MVPDLSESNEEIELIKYTTYNDYSVFTNLLFIDKSISQYQTFIDGASSTTFPILYSSQCDITNLKEFLFNSFSNIERICIAFHGYSIGAVNTSTSFVQNSPFFIDSDLIPDATDFSPNVLFIKQLISNLTVKNIDYLGCNLLTFTNWKTYFELIDKDPNVTVGASNDETGNLNYGGNWIMENTNENIKQIYFNETIDTFIGVLYGTQGYIGIDDDHAYFADNSYFTFSDDGTNAKITSATLAVDAAYDIHINQIGWVQITTGSGGSHGTVGNAYIQFTTSDGGGYLNDADSWTDLAGGLMPSANTSPLDVSVDSDPATTIGKRGVVTTYWPYPFQLLHDNGQSSSDEYSIHFALGYQPNYMRIIAGNNNAWMISKVQIRTNNSSNQWIYDGTTATINGFINPTYGYRDTSSSYENTLDSNYIDQDNGDRDQILFSINNNDNYSWQGFTVTTIGAYAFAGTAVNGVYPGTDVKTITLANTVTTIEYGAFLKCTSLTSFDISGSSSYFEVDSGGVLYNNGKTILIAYPANKTGNSFTIPNTVLTVGPNAFNSCINLRTITIPTTVVAFHLTALSDSAFTDAGNTVSILYNTVEQWNGTDWDANATVPSLSYSNANNPKRAYISSDTYLEYEYDINNTYEDVKITNIFPQSPTTWQGDLSISKIRWFRIQTGSGTHNGTTGNAYIQFTDYTTTGDTASANTNAIWSTSQKLFDHGQVSGATYYIQFALDYEPTYIKIIAGSEDGWQISQVGIGRYNSLMQTIYNGSSITGTASPTYVGNLTNTTTDSAQYIDSDSDNYNYVIFDSESNSSTAYYYTVTSIDDNTFENCTTMTSVTIHDSVTSIGASAFKGCTGLTTVTIPDLVTSIGNNAFDGCTSLTTVTIPDSVISIGNNAFDGCTSLTTITLPYNATISITTSFISTHFPNSTIETITYKNITYKVSNQSVYSNTSPTETSVVITKIPGTDVNVTSIGTEAFENNTALTAITIPDTVTSANFANDAFSGCNNGSLIIQYHNVKYKPNYNGTGTGQITDVDNITLDIDINTLNTTSPYYVIYDQVPGTIIDVISIGAEAFQNNTALTAITIPDSVTSIGNHAFDVCTALTTVTISSSSKLHISNNGNGGTIGEGAFRDCGLLKTLGPTTATDKIKIPSGITILNTSIFNDCMVIDDVEILGDVTSIGNYAFKNCNFSTITIPSNVTTIGIRAFELNTALTTVNIPDLVTSLPGIEANSAFLGCNALTTVTLPDSALYDAKTTTFIADYITLNNSSTIETITYKKIIYTNKVSPQTQSVSSNTLTTENSVEILTKIPGTDVNVTSIDATAFQNKTSLISIIIPDSVTSADTTAFSGCSNASLIIQYNNLKYKPNYSTSSPIGGQITDVVDTTIAMSEPITSPIIGTTIHVISIGAEAFTPETVIYGSTTDYEIAAINGVAATIGLTSITIPDTVTSIGGYAFDHCSLLHTVTINSTSDLHISGATIGNKVFRDCLLLTQLGPTAGKIIIPSGITSLTESLFNHCHAITDVIIPSSVTSIGNYVFVSNTALRNCLLPNNTVTSIGSEVFQNCPKLTNFIVPYYPISTSSLLSSNTFDGATIMYLKAVDSSGNIWTYYENKVVNSTTDIKTLIESFQTDKYGWSQDGAQIYSIDELYNSGYTWKQILDLGHTLSACVKYRDDIEESTDETISTTLAYHIKENMPASTTTNFKINGADIGKYFN
jgi:hypothetical protein